MIRTIVFDMGNVLIHWRPQLFVDQLGVAEEDRPLLLREVFGQDVPVSPDRLYEWFRLDQGTLSFEDAVSAMQSRLPERLHSAAHTLVFDWWKRPLLPVEGMGELIRELKALGCGIYLLSNANVDLPKYFDRIPGSECFNGRIVSAEWKLLKPQPEIYRVLLREYALKAEECFFVDDLPQNVEAAVREGISGAVFQGTDQLRQALIQAGLPLQPLCGT
ncbi:HAD-IA family hydrolase [Pseudoflavonifractor sp. 60]|uniref:HAD family hydrolase n=1 Tax=Pseudoflavonifractor sp. 60 TaxID=2304576 RepID=UPI001371ED3F|nr:HAD-IA family hydrolase [Pseudoflavonifractor sp. 60]